MNERLRTLLAAGLALALLVGCGPTANEAPAAVTLGPAPPAEGPGLGPEAPPDAPPLPTIGPPPTPGAPPPTPTPAGPAPTLSRDQFTNDWTMFRYGLDRAGYNPRETRLKPPLVIQWEFKTDDKI